MASVVESAVLAGSDEVFARWLVGEAETGELVASPEGSGERLRFGAVRTVGREVELTWLRFVRNPGRVVRQLSREGARLDRPVIVAERDGDWVWLAVGSHCAAGTADAVVLG